MPTAKQMSICRRGATKCRREYRIPTLLHKPLRCACCSADAHCLYAVEPLWVNLFGTLYLMAVGIDAPALVVKHLTVAALMSADKQHEVVARGKRLDVWHAVGHLTADGVERAESGIGRDMLLYVVDDAMKLVKRFCGLRIEIDITAEVEVHHIVELLYDDGMTLCLTNKTEHLGMTILPEDYNLGVGLILILRLDALLQLQHNRTGGIDNLDIIAERQLICRRRFPMGTKQHLRIMETTKLIMVDGYQSHALEPLTFHTVVNDVTKAIELCAVGKLFLCLLYSCCHSEAETTAVVYLYLKHCFISNIIGDLGF